ncbi:MAG TPA: DNRLRE domain-containing protein, partial [Actinomycetota bacterium]|nr:DNRLRE domain-containing protein [Actinomycetota bacterium]
MAKRRKQTLPALLIGPVALLAVRLFPAFGPMLVGGLPQPRRRMGVMERLGRDRLVAGAMLLFLTLVMYTAPGTEEAQAAAAIQYRGFIGSATGAACSAPSTTAVAADEDSHVKQSTPTANAGSASVLSVRSAPGDNDRAYIHFPLPAIPADCALSAATLRLTTTSALNNRWYDVYRATGAWTESGVTWDNQPGGTGIPATARTGPGTIEWEV